APTLLGPTPCSILRLPPCLISLAFRIFLRLRLHTSPQRPISSSSETSSLAVILSSKKHSNAKFLIAPCRKFWKKFFFLESIPSSSAARTEKPPLLRCLPGVFTPPESNQLSSSAASPRILERAMALGRELK